MNHFFIGAVNDLITLIDSEDWAIDLLTNETTFEVSKTPTIKKPKVTLSAYNDSAIPVKG